PIRDILAAAAGAASHRCDDWLVAIPDLIIGVPAWIAGQARNDRFGCHPQRVKPAMTDLVVIPDLIRDPRWRARHGLRVKPAMTDLVVIPDRFDKLRTGL